MPVAPVAPVAPAAPVVPVAPVAPVVSVAPTVHVTPIVPVSQAEKLEKFSGTDFKRWQQKMLFYLTTLHLARYLYKEAPKQKKGDAVDFQTMAAIDAWKQGDFLCKNYIMNGLDNMLYNVYSVKESAKVLWESLDLKYKIEDVGSKKFSIGRFLDYKMQDSKTVMIQVQEIQLIIHDLHVEGIILNEPFQVGAIIENFPPSWRDFKNYLKHKRKEMKLEELIVRLRIEEDNRKSERRVAGGQGMHGKANIVEQGQGSRFNKKRKFYGKIFKQGFQGGNKKFKGKCYTGGKEGHQAKDCRHRRDRAGKGHANMAEEFHLSDGIGDIRLSCVVMSKINLVGNPKEWWVDIGATRHVCCDKKMFSTYKECGEQLFMGNSSIAKVASIGKVILKMTSGKELTLNNVLHVPEISKNLIAGSLMLKNGFKLVFESDEFVITKAEMYVGRGYMTDGMFKLNTMTIVPKNSMNKKGESSVYIVDSSILWNGRLGHVNYGSLKRMVNLECLPKIAFDPNHKCLICVEAKMTKVPFKNVERNTEPLGLIHTDICDLKFIQTTGGKKYFITFIDDSSRYCYIYLLRSKDETMDVFKHYKLEVENQLAKR